MRKHKTLLLAFIIFISLFSLISCKSKDERSMLYQIKRNGFVDLSIYCKEFDEIIIYDEGNYYYENNNKEWIGPKIYYFLNGNVQKVINIRFCAADVPYGDVIDFFPFQEGKIILGRNKTLLYLTSIEKYKSGNILRLESQKRDMQVHSFY